jgi:hypothetical protein
MKTRNLILCVGAAVLLGACIPSVNPYYTAKDVVYDARLTGIWSDPDDAKNSWQFDGNGTNAYDLVITEDGTKSATFKAVLFKLKGQLYLDTMPRKFELREDQPAMVAMSVIPGHLLFRVRELEPHLKLDGFDWDWLKKYLETHPKALAHRRTDDKDIPLVLTAEPRELQRFVLKHLKEGELFKVSDPAQGLTRRIHPPAVPTSSSP